MGLVLHGGRLTLRPWQPADAGPVAEILADPLMHEHLALPNPYTRSDAERYVGQTAPQAAADGSELMLAMAENTSGRVIGSIALRGLSRDSTVTEIGYWVARSQWGRGYAREAVGTLTRFALAVGARRVEILTDVTNLASAKVALAAGFGFEAVLRSRLPLPAAGRPAVDSADGAGDAALFARTSVDSGEPIRPAWPAPGALGDGVVSLRPLGPDDASAMQAEDDNEESRRWSMFPPMTLAAARARAARGGLDWLTGGSAPFVIVDAASSAPAGVLTLRRGGPPGLVSLGYGVLPEFRGRGFTARALRVVADWLFAATATQRIELGCKAANVASAVAAERGGFQAEGRSPSRLANLDGSFSDEVRYYRLR